MDATPYTNRQKRLAGLLANSSLDAVAVNPGPTLVYLTGLHFHLMERPVIVLFSKQTTPCIILPELESTKLAALSYPLQAFTYSEDPQTWNETFHRALTVAGVDHASVGVEPTRLRLLELRFLEAASPHARFIPGDEVLVSLRLRKDEHEAAAMRKAVDIAQRALQATLPSVRIGVTERELAGELTLQLLRAGSEPEIPFSPIVAGGPNSANPHAVPTDRPLRAGDLLLFDWGATYHGYISDLTRTFAIGEVDAEYKRIAAIVLAANSAGRAAAMPGAAAEDVDRAAREVIAAQEYGEYFTHRTGHGIGMEGHEAPYIRQGNDEILQPGMAFTVEPGIYLPGRNGVRIEDNLIITENGAECLSDLPRELIRLV